MTLTDMYAASLFLRSIKAACAFPPLIDSEDFLALTSDAKGKGQADTVSPSKTRQGTLADLVREFRIYNHSDSSKQGISMGRGGGSMIRDIIATIPKLEKVELRVDMLDHCKKPIYDVLVSKIGLKTLMLQSGLQNDTILVQFKELVEHILSKDNCKDLQSLDVSLLDGCPSQRLNFLRSWPTVTSHLKSIHLLRPHVTAAHLEVLCQQSKHTLEELSLRDPSTRLTSTRSLECMEADSRPSSSPWPGDGIRFSRSSDLTASRPLPPTRPSHPSSSTHSSEPEPCPRSSTS